jgi:rhodanese-related sulfurtransferase
MVSFRTFVAVLALACTALAAEPPATAPSAPSTPPANAPKVAPAEFEKLAGEKGSVVLDVRTPKEFAEGHIAGAVNIDYKAKDFPQKVAELDKGKTYLVYCALGGRSTGACDKLTKMDFPHLYNLDGGITRWQREGKKVEKD